MTRPRRIPSAELCALLSAHEASTLGDGFRSQAIEVCKTATQEGCRSYSGLDLHNWLLTWSSYAVEGEHMRTLFNASILRRAIDDENTRSGHDYEWSPEIRTMRIMNSRVIVNPQIGAWITLDQPHEINTSASAPQTRVGGLLHKIGLCTDHGNLPAFKLSSAHTEYLYFFEFAVTTGCNLNCSYCFAEATPPSLGEEATFELAEHFINRIAEYRISAKTNIPFIIEFTGGEPLLNFRTIRHTIEYANRQFGDSLGVSFCIQSNFTVLTKEIINFLRQHKVDLGGSCDGFRIVHDTQRPFVNGKGSHAVVEKHFNLLRESRERDTGGVISVVTSKSVDKMQEIFLYFFLQGFREVVFRPLQQTGRGKSGDSKAPRPEEFVEQLFTLLNSVVTPIYHETGELIIERSLSLTFQHLFNPYRPFMCERSPCGAARNICAVMPNGEVFSCNQAVGNDQFLLGNLRTTSFLDMFSSDIACALRKRTIDEIPVCKDCVFRGWCQSPCPLAASAKYGTIMARSAECDLLRLRYKRALEGLLNNEFDLAIVGRLAGLGSDACWFEYPTHMPRR